MNGARLKPIVLALWFVAAPAHAQILVDTCGQEIKSDGFLAADLDCSAGLEDAVIIDSGGSLDLAGFTLTAALISGVRCVEGSCEIFSSAPGGAIVTGGMTQSGVSESGSHSVTVRNVAVSGARWCVRGGKVRIYDATISDCITGVLGGRNVEIERSTIFDCDEFAVETIDLVPKAKVTLEDTLISDNGGVYRSARGKLRVENATLRDNASGVFAKSARLENSLVLNNDDHGIDVLRQLKVEGGEVSGNGIVAPDGNGGLSAGRVSVRNALITGNEIGIRANTVASVKDSTVSGNTLPGTAKSVCSAARSTSD